MIPVYQTIVDKNKGNCMQAAIASLLEMNLNEVPNFIESNNPWGDFFQFILDSEFEFHGTLYNHPIFNESCKPEYNTIHKLKDEVGFKGCFFASVYSPKYYNWEIPWEQAYPHVTHAVICNKNWEIIHDPNPFNANLKTYPRADKLGYNGILSVSLITTK